MSYTIYIGGSDRARKQWGNGRVYKLRSSALRRMRQIKAAKDFGVATIWLSPVPPVG